jgi:hypothetical protein
MKISKYILIYTISLCMAAQVSSISQVCLGPDHSDSNIDWASNCHTHTGGDPDSHETFFGHKENDCIDISISSIAGSGGCFRPDDQFNHTKPIILTPATAYHPFSCFAVSKLKTNLFPAFTNMPPLSIASTILII